MVDALRHEGVDAGILTTNENGADSELAIPTGQWFQHEGVPVLAFPRWSPPLRPLREFAFSPALSFWLASNIQQYQLLHVHALFSYPSTSAMAQARRAGVPYILRSIGQLSPWSLSRSSGRKRLMLRLIERRNLQGAARLHFTTIAEQTEAAALGIGTPSMVLPLGVTLPMIDAFEAEKPSDGTVRFLFLSRLHPKKQLDRLLDAFGLLMARHPQACWELRIAGSGDPAYVAALQQKAGELGISERCLWLGFLEGTAKWEALRQAHWFVLPSAAENFGIAVVEALAAGTPVIVSPQVAVAESIASAGAGLISESDPALLAEALATALNGPSTRMRIAARSLAGENYSWKTIASQLSATYTHLLSPSALR
jgi:glycosyltransferase involved in cell wall biosynthesis